MTCSAPKDKSVRTSCAVPHSVGNPGADLKSAGRLAGCFVAAVGVDGLAAATV